MLDLALDLIDNLLGPFNGAARLDWLIRSIIKVLSKPVARQARRHPAGWMPKPWKGEE